MEVVEISSENYSGQTAGIILTLCNGNTLDLGYQQLPYNYYPPNEYLYQGTYTLTFNNGSECLFVVPCVTPTPTPTTSYPTQGVCFGYLYNFFSVINDGSNSITSSNDWSVPSQTDWNTLLATVGATNGNSLKLIDTTTYWDANNTNATNSFGFNGIGGGTRNNAGFMGQKITGYYQSRTQYDAVTAIQAYLFSINSNFIVGGAPLKTNGVSIRLVRNSTTLAPGQTGTYIGNNGTTYNTICIGTQEWMSENLRETLERDFTPIPNITDQNTWNSQQEPAYCIYNNDSFNINGCYSTSPIPTNTPTPTPTIQLKLFFVRSCNGCDGLYITYGYAMLNSLTPIDGSYVFLATNGGCYYVSDYGTNEPVTIVSSSSTYTSCESCLSFNPCDNVTPTPTLPPPTPTQTPTQTPNQTSEIPTTYAFTTSYNKGGQFRIINSTNPYISDSLVICEITTYTCVDTTLNTLFGGSAVRSYSPPNMGVTLYNYTPVGGIYTPKSNFRGIYNTGFQPICTTLANSYLVKTDVNGVIYVFAPLTSIPVISC